MAELTSSTREAAQRLGVSDTTMHKGERTGRITREPDGQWNIAKLRLQMCETADPQPNQHSAARKRGASMRSSSAITRRLSSRSTKEHTPPVGRDQSIEEAPLVVGHGRPVDPLPVGLVEREGLRLGDLIGHPAPEQKSELGEIVADAHGECGAA